MNEENKEIIKKIIKLFKPYKWKIVMVVSTILISSCLNLILPIINQKLMDEGLIVQDLNVIIKCSILSLLLIVLIQGVGIIETKYRTYIENIISFNLEKSAFRQTLKMKMNFFNSTNYAQIMNNIQTDIGKISGLCDRNTFYIMTSVFRIIVGVIGISLISWKLSLLVVIVTPIRYIIVKFLADKRKKMFKNYIKIHQEYSGWQGDTLAGIKEVKAWVLEDLKISEFIKKQRELIKQNIKIAYLENANMISEVIFSQIVSTLIYIIGGYLIVGQELTVGKLYAFITYSAYVTDPIFAIMNIRYTFAGILPSAKRYFDFMNEEYEGYSSKGKLLRIKAEETLGTIEFKNVKFSYSEKESILKGIDFKINAGEKVAIIGRNGAGKTTIINLILRFLTPTSGEILLDGKDINSINLKDYRNLISMVSQEIYLFNKTIKENIMLNSKKEDSEMYSVIKKCGADKFIEEMPDQYESIVGERGSKLSGGERQKIAMARALLRESKILILDEATANYDIKAEQEINNVIRESYKDKTTIMITHRPDVLRQVDKVIVINNGQVEDMGNHEELYERNEFYRQMVNIPDGVTV